VLVTGAARSWSYKGNSMKTDDTIYYTQRPAGHEQETTKGGV